MTDADRIAAIVRKAEDSCCNVTIDEIRWLADLARPYIAKSFTRYSVIVEGSVVRYYDNIDAAITFARSAVFLATERVVDMDALLRAGQIAEWSYGFSAVAVYPPRDANPATRGEMP